MKTLLVITPSRNTTHDCICHILVADTGEHLASHFCSNGSFAYGDLYAHRPERIKEWTKRFGELEVKYLEETNITQETLLQRNKEWGEKQGATKIA